MLAASETAINKKIIYWRSLVSTNQATAGKLCG